MFYLSHMTFVFFFSKTFEGGTLVIFKKRQMPRQTILRCFFAFLISANSRKQFFFPVLSLPRKRLKCTETRYTQQGRPTRGPR